MVGFIWGDKKPRIQYGFSILLPAADAVRMFGAKLKLSCIAAVSQAHLRPRLILNLLVKQDEGTPSFNQTTEREVALESMLFGRASPCILQSIWEVDPVQGPIRVSKLDVIDAYHCGTSRMSKVGAFTYVIPLATGDEGCIICINLVLPMG